MTTDTTICVPPAAPVLYFHAVGYVWEDRGPMITFLTPQITPMASACLKSLGERTREDHAKVRVVTTNEVTYK